VKNVKKQAAVKTHLAVTSAQMNVQPQINVVINAKLVKKKLVVKKTVPLAEKILLHALKQRKKNVVKKIQQKPKINNAKKHKNETKIYFNADDSKHTIFSKHSGQ
jgi:hypothetical protein